MTTQVARTAWRVPTVRETARWLGPDGVLAVAAIGRDVDLLLAEAAIERGDEPTLAKLIPQVASSSS